MNEWYSNWQTLFPEKGNICLFSVSLSKLWIGLWKVFFEQKQQGEVITTLKSNILFTLEGDYLSRGHVSVTAPQGSTAVCSGASSIRNMFFMFLLLARRTTLLPMCPCMFFILFGCLQSSWYKIILRKEALFHPYVLNRTASVDDVVYFTVDWRWFLRCFFHF